MVLDERTLVSQLSPLKRVVCLCPVPLGRGRVSWSGGGINSQIASADAEFASNSAADDGSSSAKLRKYRYGERYAIGVAVSDPYLSHAFPVDFAPSESSRYGVDGNGREFMAEVVPTYRCDAHNFGQSPILHINLPYFQRDFLQRIGHPDVGAIVVALPMKPTRPPFCPMPPGLEMEEERAARVVRESIFNVLQNYVTMESEEDDEFGAGVGKDDVESAKEEERGVGDGIAKRRPPLGPLNLQGYTDERLTAADVSYKAREHDYGNWDQLAMALDHSRMGVTGAGNGGSLQGASPGLHAAVALNAMLENCTGGWENRSF